MLSQHARVAGALRRSLPLQQQSMAAACCASSGLIRRAAVSAAARSNSNVCRCMHTTAAAAAPANAPAAAAASTESDSSSTCSGSGATSAPATSRRLSSLPVTATLSSSLRSSFLSFFQSQGHMLLPSSSLVPDASDESLLFVNAGMVPLKSLFLNQTAPLPASGGRLTSAQKCIRAGGKHNDLENVGHTARHHTFFEMLGNFSIGSGGRAYFKEEALWYAWQYVTRELQLDSSRLRVSVHSSDDESHAIWRKLTGWSDASGRIVRLGDADNFWSMGDVVGAPCGPCSEIFVDQGEEVDGDRWLEVWNVVFMQYARTGTKEQIQQAAAAATAAANATAAARGGGGIITPREAADAFAANTSRDSALPPHLTRLQYPCVDTGMGLERITAVMQDRPTNYDTDVFARLIDTLEHIVQSAAATTKPTGANDNAHRTLLAAAKSRYQPSIRATPRDAAVRVIVDHIRSSAFLIAAGIVPSNVGRGYVLRRIIRRAMRFALAYLGLAQPFLHRLVQPLVDTLGHVYPELQQHQSTIETTIRVEEQQFGRTISRGVKLLEEELDAIERRSTSSGGTRTLSGDVAFQLYDSCGFPVDLVDLIVRERAQRSSPPQQWSVDMERFNQLMQQQRETSKASGFAMSIDSSSSSSPSAATPAASAPSSPSHSQSKPLKPPGLPRECQSWRATKFVGYDGLTVIHPDVIGTATAAGDASHVCVAITPTPFYAAAGGQVGDVGTLTLSNGMQLAVVDCLKASEGGASVLKCQLPPSLAPDALPSPLIVSAAAVDQAHRAATAQHHTATHLLHAAIKSVLPRVTAAAAAASSSSPRSSSSSSSPIVLTSSLLNQSGSLVGPDRLRFDFSCPIPLKPEWLAEIEKWINDAIVDVSIKQHAAAAGHAELRAASVSTEVMPVAEAMAMNATALFGEKYGEQVRVVSVPGYSSELCGGTHVRNVRDCYPVVIVSESGIASGIRRIEAVAGAAAVKLLQQSHCVAKELRGVLKQAATVAELPAAVQRLQAKIKQLEDENRTLQRKVLLSGSGTGDAVATTSSSSPTSQRNATALIDATYTLDGTPVPVKLQEIPLELASNNALVRDACASLPAPSTPNGVHILLCAANGVIAVVAIGSVGGAAVSAKRVLAHIQARLQADDAKTQGKGGGNDKLALGVLPTAYAMEEPLSQRVVRALKS